jgi:hypothetical protein
MLRLEAIKFNHDPSSANVDAFNIRKNEREFVEVPEWRRGLTFNPEDSPAAYSLLDTRGNTLTIQASFSCDDRRPRTIEVRALDARLYPRASGASALLDLADRLLELMLDDSRVNILGEVKAKRIKLCDGKSDFETFKLKNVRIWAGGVAVEDIAWRWQYRVYPDDSWTDLAVTKHRIYTTLRRPHEPWQQTRFERSNLQLPWTAVLEHACRWAAGAQNPTDAATLITRGVYQLGKDGIASYCGSSQYSFGRANVFKCAEFLFDLSLGTMKLNCTDCATIVSTFANILGSELWQSEMIGFDYNPILRIGESKWREGHFDSHVVAWEEDCDAHNDVFDACLQVDGDQNPTNADRCHVALLPEDLRFGRSTENLYRGRLVAPVNLENAGDPQPLQRRRRFIQNTPFIGTSITFTETSIAFTETSILSQEVLDSASQHFNFDFEQWAYQSAEDRLFQVGSLPKLVLDGWIELRSEQLITDKGMLRESLWRASPGGADSMVLINTYEGSSVQAARKWLYHSIASIHSLDGVRKEQVDVADIFFILGKCGITFSLANRFVSLVNVGNSNFSLSTIAQNLLQKLAAV